MDSEIASHAKVDVAKEQSRLLELDKSAQTKILRRMYREQRATKRLGFAFELLGFKVRGDLARKYHDYSFNWTGFSAYNGEAPRPGADFEDCVCGKVSTDEYKNTSGNYYPSQYVKNPSADHYTFGKVPSKDATDKYLRSHGKSCLVVGRQTHEFPLNDDGSVKKEFLSAYRQIRLSLFTRIILPHLNGTHPYSNSKRIYLTICMVAIGLHGIDNDVGGALHFEPVRTWGKSNPFLAVMRDFSVHTIGNRGRLGRVLCQNIELHMREIVALRQCGNEEDGAGIDAAYSTDGDTQ